MDRYKIIFHYTIQTVDLGLGLQRLVVNLSRCQIATFNIGPTVLDRPVSLHDV